MVPLKLILSRPSGVRTQDAVVIHILFRKCVFIAFISLIFTICDNSVIRDEKKTAFTYIIKSNQYIPTLLQGCRNKNNVLPCFRNNDKRYSFAIQNSLLDDVNTQCKTHLPVLNYTAR